MDFHMRVLVFAPHPDDEILGCGGTIKKHILQGDRVDVQIITTSKNQEAARLNNIQSEKARALLGINSTCFLNFPPVELNHVANRELTNALKAVLDKVQPDIVYIPFFGDIHIDHITAANAIMVALRPISAPYVKEVYAYETLSETGWNFPIQANAFMPNYFVDISDYIKDKTNAMLCYDKKIRESTHPRSVDGIISLAKYRGASVGVQYAEAFIQIRRLWSE